MTTRKDKDPLGDFSAPQLIQALRGLASLQACGQAAQRAIICKLQGEKPSDSDAAALEFILKHFAGPNTSVPRSSADVFRLIASPGAEEQAALIQQHQFKTNALFMVQANRHGYYMVVNGKRYELDRRHYLVMKLLVLMAKEMPGAFIQTDQILEYLAAQLKCDPNSLSPETVHKVMSNIRAKLPKETLLVLETSRRNGHGYRLSTPNVALDEED